MRRRLRKFLPIVLMAVMVQILAPVAACWAASIAGSDPLHAAAICHDDGGANSGQTGQPRAHDGCCSVCSVAHEIVGNRFFPATLGIDDPGVNDELSLPTVAVFKTGDDPSFKQRDISAEFSKRITEAFAVSFGVTHTHLSAPGGPTGMGANGFQNLETTFKYRLVKDPEHEFVMSVGLSVEWGGTGAQSGGADPFNTYTPTLFFGKGLGG